MLQKAKNLIARSALQLSPEKLELLAGGKPYVWEGRMLDAQLHLIAKAYEAENPLHAYPIKLARAQYEAEAKLLDSKPRQRVTVKNRTIQLDTEAGKRSIGIRIYQPSQTAQLPDKELSDKQLPVMVYYHGGGWSIGSLESVDALCSGFAEDLHHVVVSVDYRLAPEHKFPAAADDALDSFLWTKANAAHYGGDENRVYVAGDSAGGNLAAVVSQQTVKRGLPSPCAQVLIYPATNLDISTLSHHTYAEGLPLTAGTFSWFVGMYMRDEKDKYEIKASPELAQGDWLANLPPALITTAGFDVLRDEGASYAEFLKRAGVSVSYHEYANLMHAYVTMTGHIYAARDAVKDTTRRIGQLIGKL